MSTETNSNPPNGGGVAESASTALLQWLAQFGLNESTTELRLFEGRGPEERGLRRTKHLHTVYRKGDYNLSAAASAVCPCNCASSVAPADPSPPSPSSCRCFSDVARVAPILAIPSVLLITPAKVRASALVKAMMTTENVQRATDSEVRSTRRK